MKQLTKTDIALVFRADFSNDLIWQEICSEILEPVGVFRFRTNVEFLDDVEYTGIRKQQLLELVPHNYNHSVIVDQIAISHPDHPLLSVDLYEGSGNESREQEPYD